jgi:hypothetical protein
MATLPLSCTGTAGSFAAAAIELHGVYKRFPTPSGQVYTALRNLNLTIAPGEFCAVVGPTGRTTPSSSTRRTRSAAGGAWPERAERSWGERAKRVSSLGRRPASEAATVRSTPGRSGAAHGDAGQDPAWQPALPGAQASTFTMADLLRCAGATGAR